MSWPPFAFVHESQQYSHPLICCAFVSISRHRLGLVAAANSAQVVTESPSVLKRSATSPCGLSKHPPRTSMMDMASSGCATSTRHVRC